MPPRDSPQRPGSLWPRGSHPDTTKGYDSFMASSNFYLWRLSLAGAQANETSKSYRKALLQSQQHLRGHIPNALITIFPLLKPFPFYCFIGSNAVPLEPTLRQSIYTPKQPFKQTNKAEEMPVSSLTHIKLCDDTSTRYSQDNPRVSSMPLWLGSGVSPGLVMDSRQMPSS